MKPIPAEIKLKDKQEAYLSKLYRGSYTPLHLKQKSEIIIAASKGITNFQIARC